MALLRTPVREMTRRRLFLALAGAVAVHAAVQGQAARREIEVFAGSASKPAAEEVARLFEQKTGTRVLLQFGGSGAMLAQMELTGRGDVYFPGSSDFLEVAVRRRLVDPKTAVRVVYLLPAINVPKGNPKGIKSLEDLARKGLRLGMARPDTVCVGLYGVEVLERRGLSARVRPNVVNYAESCEKTAQMVSLEVVDAVLGWEVFGRWDPARIETVHLRPEEIPRIGFIPAALATNAKDPALGKAFLAFLAGPESQAVFRRHGYLTDLEAARRLARPDTPVGGEYRLPDAWR